ncbi:MAG: hypothetical protein K8T91_22965 [Planctomycetes bacterium]|nr:hypothetical protein [Planctomycetota bacterium]
MGRFAVRSKDERAAVFVTNALERSADWQSRVAAVDALEHEEAGVLPGLRKALEVAANSDRACTVRIHASLVLLRGGQKEYAEVLRRMAASPEQDVRLELAYSVGVSAPTVSVLLELLADTSPEVAGASWEQLSKAMPSVNYASPPTSPEEGREMARAYRKAWLERS